MIHSNDIKQETLVERVIGASARNKFLIVIFTVFAVAAGVYGLLHTSLDAIPDLSDVQVIIYTDWEGRSPDLVEDQITYPISARFISAPKVKFVRGESMFGKSFVYVIFEDGTDIYWARSRVLEYLNSARGSLPANVNPVIGPDATGVGWVYEYALIDKSGKHSLADLRSFQDWTLRYALESVKGVSEVASVGGFVKQYQVDLDPNALVAYNLSVKDIASAIQASNNDVGGKTSEVATTEYFVRGHGYIRGPADIEDIVLKVQNGTPVYVKNIARVHLGGDLRRGVAELDGKGEVVGGIVVMRYGENALNVISGVKKKLEELKSSLPDGRPNHSDLRSQRDHHESHRNASGKAHRRKHRCGAGMHRFPLARAIRARRDNHAADCDHFIVCSAVFAWADLEHHVPGRYCDRDWRDD